MTITVNATQGQNPLVVLRMSLATDIAKGTA
jgi:hypothetical protein